MRIFIHNNINPNKITELLKNYHQYSEQYVEIYSKEGIYKITSNNLFQLKHSDIPLEKIENFLGSKVRVIIDKSDIINEIAYQIPANHLNILIKKNYYGLHENSAIKYVIEETYDATEYFKNKILPKNETDINMNTCYIEVPNNLNLHDTNIKSDIYKLLSWFN